MDKALATIPSNNTLLLWIQIGHKVVTSTKPPKRRLCTFLLAKAWAKV